MKKLIRQKNNVILRFDNCYGVAEKNKFYQGDSLSSQEDFFKHM